MSIRTKRYIIPTGSFNAIYDQLNTYANTKSNTSLAYDSSAVTSSCNWSGKAWCDVTFAVDTGSRANALSESNIYITKLVWAGVTNATGSMADTYDISFI